MIVCLRQPRRETRVPLKRGPLTPLLRGMHQTGVNRILRECKIKFPLATVLLFAMAL